MSKFFLLFLLTGLLFLCFSQKVPKSHPLLLKEYIEAEKIFQQAETLSIKAGENEKLLQKADDVYAKSLELYEKVNASIEKGDYDSLSFFTLLKKGLLSFYLRKNKEAKENYLSAIILKKHLVNIQDSFLFAPLLYTGGIYYSQNLFDSAFYLYKKAEAIKNSYKEPLMESQRLYNRLGAMYYETGNYKQARNYFEKAITVLNSVDHGNQYLLINYKINIASLLINLEEYAEAQKLYQSLVPYNIYLDQIYHNLGIINIRQNNYSQAIDFFNKVHDTNNKDAIDLYYNYAVAYSFLNKADSTKNYIRKALKENNKWNGHQKNITFGLLLKFLGDEAIRKQQLDTAAIMYQQAITQFYHNFTDTSVLHNPEFFSGIFSYINLFNTLIAKAEVFEKKYYNDKSLHWLELSLSTYKSAFKLTKYVEQTYDSDEARIFLGKIKYTVHSQPIDISLLLYTLTKKKIFLEDAWFFDQQNKASILSFNIHENEWRKQLGFQNNLFQEEAMTKSAITRLSLRTLQLTDSLEILKANTSIRDYEIALGKIREKINNDPAFRGRNILNTIPTIDQLQQKLDNTTAIVSYHLTKDELLIFFLKAKKFEYFRLKITEDFFKNIDSFKNALQLTSSEERYSGNNNAKHLYQLLILPLTTILSQINRIIIIPDDELNYLPFEALQDENNQYLVERYSILYQYTASISENKKSSPETGKKTLGVAPFSSKKFIDSFGNSMSQLPESGEEINRLKGKILLDSQASKSNFLNAAIHFDIIHLATHASVNNNDPNLSFIAFYPGTNDYRLYAGEIYNLRLDSAELVILSACETGSGQLVKGEGLMSISRAFAYAGCQNIVTSFWKAEDRATSFLTQRLHYYLEKNYTKDVALQAAKLDLLKNNEMEPRYKTPSYWAHLILIGNYEPSQKSNNWWWVAFTILIVFIGYYLFKRKA